jgi:hypothetical protein
MPEVKLTGPSMEQRINNRLRNSGTGSGTIPDKTVQTGNSARRTFTSLHHAAGHLSPSNAENDRDGGDWRK